MNIYESVTLSVLNCTAVIGSGRKKKKRADPVRDKDLLVAKTLGKH